MLCNVRNESSMLLVFVDNTVSVNFSDLCSCERAEKKVHVTLLLKSVISVITTSNNVCFLKEALQRRYLIVT